MKKMLMNNLGLKIGAVILAFIVWFLVVNISDPVRTQTYSDIPITVTNSAYVESMGLSYQLNSQDQVSVTIRSSNSIVNRITASDIVVTADLTQIVNMESDPVMVPLVATCTKYPSISSDDITVTPGNARITLENYTSADFVVTPSTGDTRPDINYEVGSMQAEPERITISGPESLINKIDNVIAQVDVTGITQDSVLSGTISVIDKNQEVLPDSQMSYLTLRDIQADQSINVSVVLWSVKTDVELRASYSGEPADGYQVAEVDFTPSTITVVGSKDALEALERDGNHITIPASEIDVTGKSADFETRVDINDFLPEDIRLATNVSSSVLVTTVILPYGSRVFEVPVTNITIQNLASDLRAVLDANNIQVRIQGADEQLEALNAEDIRGTIDMSEYGVGEYQIPVNISLPTGLELVDQVTVDAIVSSTEQETPINQNN